MAATPPVCDFGVPAPDFELIGTDGRRYRRDAVMGSNGLVVMFICNHCPFVKAVLDKIVRDAAGLKGHGIGSVAISSNDPTDYPEDSFENMKALAARRHFPFPYLWDETQEVAKAYTAACTPDFFLFDADRALAYRGQLDDSRPSNGLPVTGKDLRAAIEAVLSGEPVSDDQRASIGCSIKWRAGNEPAYA